MRSCRQRPFVSHLLVIVLATAARLGTLSESVALPQVALGNSSAPTRIPLVRVTDLNVGESQTVELHDGSKTNMKLLDLKETRDNIRNAVRRAAVTIEVNLYFFIGVYFAINQSKNRDIISLSQCLPKIGHTLCDRLYKVLCRMDL